MVVAGHHEDVSVGLARMAGHLSLPDGCHALVLLGFAGGPVTPRVSGIQAMLYKVGFGSLTLDFNGGAETADRRRVVNTANLAAFMLQAIDWITRRADLAGLPRGLLINGVGAAAALRADSMRPGRIDAIVSYGGRPDLVADEQLAAVVAPTLLIVGGCDRNLERINRRALTRLTCIRRLEVLPYTRHEMDQPAALETATHLATQWFQRELRVRRLG